MQRELSVVAWRLPVFKERFSKESVNTVKLVETGNILQFADEAVAAVRDWNIIHQSQSQDLKIEKTTGGQGSNLRIK